MRRQDRAVGAIPKNTPIGSEVENHAADRIGSRREIDRSIVWTGRKSIHKRLIVVRHAIAHRAIVFHIHRRARPVLHRPHGNRQWLCPAIFAPLSIMRPDRIRTLGKSRRNHKISLIRITRHARQPLTRLRNPKFGNAIAQHQVATIDRKNIPLRHSRWTHPPSLRLINRNRRTNSTGILWPQQHHLIRRKPCGQGYLRLSTGQIHRRQIARGAPAESHKVCRQIFSCQRHRIPTASHPAKLRDGWRTRHHRIGMDRWCIGTHPRHRGPARFNHRHIGIQNTVCALHH